MHPSLGVAALQLGRAGSDVTKPGEGGSMEEHSETGRRLPSWKSLKAGGALEPPAGRWRPEVPGQASSGLNVHCMRRSRT